MGRDKRNERAQEHWTKLARPMMETDAWRALSPVAQALYPWLKLEWRGPKANNNGKIRLSVRQAADALGVTRNTAGRAFHDLQAKGFIVVRERARLGIGGNASGPSYELTELSTPHSKKADGQKLYKLWKPGDDYPIHKGAVHNPRGKRNRNPVIELVTPCHQYGDA
ncbi:hypothetical protein [Gymnodinialimonas sp.]